MPDPTGNAPSRITPTPLQQQALDEILAWRNDPGAEQIYGLGGYAGTGKTSLTPLILDDDSNGVRLIAPTGKAAHVLRGKIDGALPPGRISTIHGLIYIRDTTNQELAQQALERLKALTQRAGHEPLTASERTEHEDLQSRRKDLEREVRKMRWIKRPSLPDVQLLIADEVSMVNETVARDILSYGKKVLAIGDPAQLPPVEGNGYFTARNHDFLLDEVHRQALESPVLRIATSIRQSDASMRGYGLDGMDGDSGRISTRPDLLEFDQVLCWTRRKRWELISAMRMKLGYGIGTPPQRGDRIVILRNDRELNVFNGQIFTVYHVVERDANIPAGLMDIVVIDDDADELSVRMLRCDERGFAGLDQENILDDEMRRNRWRVPEGTVAATFAQALTVHKAQGSQWDSVLLVDQTSGLARRNTRDYAKSWLYTGVTRASEQIVVTGRAS